MKMYLSKIKISNFRSFDEQGVEAVFNKGVNAIIGENNNGKSSLIDAIRLAFSALNYKKDIYFQKKDLHINLSGVRANFSQFDIYLEDVHKYLFEIWNPETKSSGEFHVKYYVVKSPKGIEKIQFTIWGGSIEGNTLSAETLEAIDVAFLGALRDAETEMKPSSKSRLAELLGNIADNEEKRSGLVEVLQEANKLLMTKPELNNASEIINKNLVSIEQEMLSQQIDIGLVEPRFESITSSLRTWVKSKWAFVPKTDEMHQELMCIINKHNLSKYAFIEEHGVYLKIGNVLKQIYTIPDVSEKFKQQLCLIAQRDFELRQNGLGYNNLIFMSTILGDMSINKNGVLQNLFLIEEPEAHLHPQLQELVHNFFLEQHNEDSNIQVIYTSHSPTLVSKIGLDNINLIYERKYRIECLPMSKSALDDKDKGYLKKYLDVTKSQLFFAKGIIFVEGISEALLIPEIAELLNRPLDKYAVEVVNVDSVAFKPFINLLLKKEDGIKPFAKATIITDDDRCTKKSDTDLYIAKDLDFDDDFSDIQCRLDRGTPSDRFLSIQALCNDTEIKISSAFKTLEYELAFCDNNIKIITEILLEVFPDVGQKLKERVESLNTTKEKQLCVWLFIRARDKSKGEFAQKLCAFIQEQKVKEKAGKEIEYKFQVTKYIRESIEFITEKIDGGT